MRVPERWRFPEDHPEEARCIRCGRLRAYRHTARLRAGGRACAPRRDLLEEFDECQRLERQHMELLHKGEFA
jgi:hypothetical protein